MERFSFVSSNGSSTVAAYCIIPQNPRAMVQISHGMCEYFLRYKGFATYLAEQGFLVFGHDHLGHGNTAPSANDLGFTTSGGGANHLVEDVISLSQKMKAAYPDLPLVLFGHSMGSFIAREVLARHGELYSAAIICGTGGPDMPAGMGKALASLLIKCKGERYRSALLAKIAFMGYNKKIPKPCDKNAWLTRDDAVVDRYNADPFCTFTFTLRAYHDLFTLVQWVSKKDWAKRLPKSLPLLVVSGNADPVGSWGKGVQKVYRRIQKAEIFDATLTLYPQMRHEILNELESKQVWTDIEKWINKKLES